MKDKVLKMQNENVIEYRNLVEKVAFGNTLQVLIEIKEQNAELIKEIKNLKEVIKEKELKVETKTNTTKK